MSNYLVSVCRLDQPIAIPLEGQILARNAVHAVTSVAQYAGLSPAGASRVQKAGMQWACQLAEEGWAFCVMKAP